MPASGKSRVGKTCAQNHPDYFPGGFRDLDAQIEARTQKSIAEVFETEGEKAFRELELDQLRAELKSFGGILALGGGTLTSTDGVIELENYRQNGGLVVYLDVDMDLALDRIKRKNTRPLLRDNAAQKWSQLHDDRYKTFENASDLRLRISQQPADDFTEEEKHRQASVTAQQIVHALDVRRVRVLRDGAVKYNVNIGSNLVQEIPGALTADTHKVFLIHTDSVLEHAQRVLRAIQSAGYECVLHSVPDAEDAKTIAVYTECLEKMAELKMTRQDAVIGVGGGAVTDLAGFIAATYLRGIKCINVPTSLLAQVDASTGGKTGINLNAGKNLCGAFYEPKAVYVDLETLSTLPKRELIEGLAEAIKIGFTFDETVLHAIHRLVPESPQSLHQNQGARTHQHEECQFEIAVDNETYADIIFRSVSVKARVVSADLYDSGLREFLNYGHTFGHAIEKLEHYTWRHGEAVSVGMVFAAHLGHKLGMIPSNLLQEHIEALQRVGLPVFWKTNATFDDVLSVMRVDKKAQGSDLRFVLLEGKLQPRIVKNPPLSVLQQCFEEVTHP
ncbi:MAG: 3-dehydroquinate synthase [Candidatus Ancillula sp.]|jgi:shikimate kinase/3-dehydroquinate synthase|nr:3-dehydroquinate synthase [Candidatus Ancillula sp.]